ncbi:MAG: Uma2 family endonuclease [Chloroflexi bacterium]|nr:Uma2 family endonuclease [Chloroflexota bacterium]
MTIQTYPQVKTIGEVPSSDPFPLQSGDRLSRVEFERRYQAHPEIKKAELIEGVVFVSSPIHFQNHADPHFDTIAWLGAYCAVTLGVRGGDNATLRLDFENEVQPDVLLRLAPAAGGQSVISEDDYLEGAPELIVEVVASSASYDLHDKRRAYARNGVQEYLVLLAYERQVVWFVLREGVYEELQSDEKGVLQSEIFPGLWLDVKALLAGDLSAVLTTLQTGLKSPEHMAFVETLQTKLST